MIHADYNLPGSCSSETWLDGCKQLGLTIASREEVVRRMAFNVLAANLDDHVKNIAFLMNEHGRQARQDQPR